MGHPDSRARDSVSADELVAKIRPIRPLRMRCVVLLEYLLNLPDDDAVDVMADLVRRASARAEASFAEALESLLSILGDPDALPYKRRAGLYAAAKRREHHAVRRLFFDASSGRDGADEELASARPVIPRGRPVTLGERKSLARSHRRDLLIHLIRDPHPDVIRILLGNPHLTESDVLAIASRRPTSSMALAEVADNTRWGARYEIRRALVKNPYIAPALAVRLATTLRHRDLRDVARDHRLDSLLREHARGLLGDVGTID